MAQGAAKKTSKPTLPKSASGRPQQQHKAKKQSGVNKAKKAKTAADKMAKRYTSGLITRTEKMLGERAGHLELIGKGNKQAGDKKGTTFKSGSRKFG